MCRCDCWKEGVTCFVCIYQAMFGWIRVCIIMGLDRHVHLFVSCMPLPLFFSFGGMGCFSSATRCWLAHEHHALGFSNVTIIPALAPH